MAKMGSTDPIFAVYKLNCPLLNYTRLGGTISPSFSLNN